MATKLIFRQVNSFLRKFELMKDFPMIGKESVLTI